MRRAVGSFLLVVLVALAGCSGVFGGNGEPTATITPAAVPTDRPTQTPVQQFAPGLTGGGIADPEALVDAHASVLHDRSFTTTGTVTERFENGSVASRSASRLYAGPPGSGILFVTERSASTDGSGGSARPVRLEGWAENGVLLGNLTYANGTTTYNRQRLTGDDRVGVYGVGGIRYLLDAFGPRNTSVTERTRGNATRYLVRGRTRSDGLGDVRLRMVVDDRGLIQRYRIVRNSSDDGTAVQITTEGRFSGVGTTDAPDRPSWADDAMVRTTPVPFPARSPPNAMAGVPRTERR